MEWACPAAKAFIREGAKIIALGYEVESCKQAEKVLGKHAKLIQGDTRDEYTVNNVIKECVRLYGSFDGLYHVAGGSWEKIWRWTSARTQPGSLESNPGTQPQFCYAIQPGSHK